eukprot:INCI17567.1.p1 GENE.INCI17567.1~~INCI17567.1.p1  ORF type:complete len:884 (+),score=157.23 INCI17567.1:59-2710(+)
MWRARNAVAVAAGIRSFRPLFLRLAPQPRARDARALFFSGETQQPSAANPVAPAVKTSVRESAGRQVHETSFIPTEGGAVVDDWVGDLRLETGRIAPLADGSVTIRTGKTLLLTTAVSSHDPPTKSFFPLTVDAREKYYASGKIPQNFMRREMRQSDAEILRSRLVDRAVRPLFPDGYMQETQIILSLLSGDESCDLEVLYINAASAALAASDIPWNGPVAAVRVAKDGDKFVVNASAEVLKRSEFSLLFVGTGSEQEVLMLEVDGSRPIVHEEFVSAMKLAQESLKPILDLQNELVRSKGIVKRDHAPPLVHDSNSSIESEQADELRSLAQDLARGPVAEVFSTTGLTKHERQDAIAEVERYIVGKLNEETIAENTVIANEAVVQRAAVAAVRDAMRNLMLDAALDNSSKVGPRCDGRQFDELRAVTAEVGVLAGTHGSGFFRRGDTSALCTATLGSTQDKRTSQPVIGTNSDSSFMLHYDFMPYAVNETGRAFGFNRRMIGHGSLAERALLPVIPPAQESDTARKDDVFPYVVRIASETASSDGSSSMAAVCGGTLALMDAGVPISAPVAGIAMGLVVDRRQGVPLGTTPPFKILTDICALEDHFGDMDFKIAGTLEGITAAQMDCHAPVPLQALIDALEPAAEARRKILSAFSTQALGGHRNALASHAPMVETLPIDASKRGLVIGKGGETIRRLEEILGPQGKISIDASGVLSVFAPDHVSGQRCMKEVHDLLRDLEEGEAYEAKVIKVLDIGVVVSIGSQEGLVHISEVAHGHTSAADIHDTFSVGDPIRVKCLGNFNGNVRLSKKALEEDPNPEETAARQARNERGFGRGRGGRGGGRSGGRHGRGRGGGGGTRGRSGGRGGRGGRGNGRGGSDSRD